MSGRFWQEGHGQTLVQTGRLWKDTPWNSGVPSVTAALPPPPPPLLLVVGAGRNSIDEPQSGDPAVQKAPSSKSGAAVLSRARLPAPTARASARSPIVSGLAANCTHLRTSPGSAARSSRAPSHRCCRACSRCRRGLTCLPWSSRNSRKMLSQHCCRLRAELRLGNLA